MCSSVGSAVDLGGKYHTFPALHLSVTCYFSVQENLTFYRYMVYDELYSTYSTWSTFGWGYEYRSWRSSGAFSQHSITFTLLKDQIIFHTADSQKLVKDCKQWEQFAWLCPNVAKSTRQHLWSSLIDMLCRLFNPWKSVKTIVCVVLWEVICLGLFTLN